MKNIIRSIPALIEAKGKEAASKQAYKALPGIGNGWEVKTFQDRTLMHAFLNKQTNNDWKPMVAA